MSKRKHEPEDTEEVNKKPVTSSSSSSSSLRKHEPEDNEKVNKKSFSSSSSSSLLRILRLDQHEITIQENHLVMIPFPNNITKEGCLSLQHIFEDEKEFCIPIGTGPALLEYLYKNNPLDSVCRQNYPDILQRMRSNPGQSFIDAYDSILPHSTLSQYFFSFFY